MSYLRTEYHRNGKHRTPVEWYRCNITGEEICEAWPHYRVEGADVHISMGAIQHVLGPLYLKTAPVPIEIALADLAASCGAIPMGRTAISASVREIILERCGRACRRCGSVEHLQIDHIVAFKKGGTNDPDNLQVLCRSCNLKKGVRDNREFMRS